MQSLLVHLLIKVSSEINWLVAGLHCNVLSSIFASETRFNLTIFYFISLGQLNVKLTYFMFSRCNPDSVLAKLKKEGNNIDSEEENRQVRTAMIK